jgi:hypothetical protein
MINIHTMKKLILSISILTLVACTPPMKSEPNKCKCTPGHCCADTVTVKENFPSYPELQVEEPLPSHNYEEIPSNHEEIL